ncbi:MAG: hybrid sensor histidine kinase/response regulator, partial [Pyrinomonadaceae bacterium]
QMGGNELKKRVVELLPDIKVLFISGYTYDSIADSRIDDPRIAFLEKPFSPEILIRKVRDVLDG